ncbi:MAG: phosphodiester glycosidase family protein [Clostridia bacterium]|nr:phosphodiester glycosidase family protein [Clostridia bacterium]
MNNFNDNTPEKQHPLASNTIFKTAALLLMCLSIILSVLLFSSGGIITELEGSAESMSFYDELDNLTYTLNSDTVSFVYSMPIVYTLPWNEEPAPKPNPENFTDTTYEDETISVKYWKERLYDSDAHFAEIKIAHPTQIRTMLAGGKYNSNVRFIPETLARQCNAVVACNADFYAYRSGGIIIRNDVVYRQSVLGWDVLLIDDAGDFHIMSDKKVKSSGILDEYHIVNSLHFGPSLVIDGKIDYTNVNSGCGDEWNFIDSPRTAIGQIDELHYLICCVEGRTKTNRGVCVDELAQVMYDHGCTQAYNLDGGQSTTIIFNRNAMNNPLWGGQRVMSDIIYFATAIPEE